MSKYELKVTSKGSQIKTREAQGLSSTILERTSSNNLQRHVRVFWENDGASQQWILRVPSFHCRWIQLDVQNLPKLKHRYHKRTCLLLCKN
ncbi:unnamed protein product [Arabidopsis halleri]